MTARLSRPLAVLILCCAGFALACSIAHAAPGAAKETTLRTGIVSADIYGGLARVTRRGVVSLAPGTWRIVCDDLPNNLDEESIRVSGGGAAGAVILGTDLQRIIEAPEETPRYRELRSRRDALAVRRDSLDIVGDALQRRTQFLRMLAVLPTKQGEEESPPDVFRVEDWRSLMDFLQKDETETALATRDVARRIEELDQKIAAIDAELGSMKREGWRRRLVISCEATSRGDLGLDVDYNAGRAFWEPRYTIRYDAAAERIGIDYRARITQKTGEDWNGVAVTLSSAKPHVGAAPPEPAPFYLRRLRPSPRAGRKAQEILVEALPVNDVAEAVALKSGVVAHEARGAAVSSQFAASFAVPGVVDLPSGDAPKTVMLMQGNVDGTLARSTVPRLSTHAFVTAEATNALGVPLLDGRAEIYVETPAPGRSGTISTFVGREDLESVPDGGTFPVGLGVDQDIEVTFELVKRERTSKSGRSRRETRFTYEIEIESFKEKPIEVTLRDRVPVAAEKDIRVDDVDLEPKPDTRDDETGICSWKLLLEPKERRTIRIAYTISVPADWLEHAVPME